MVSRDTCFLTLILVSTFLIVVSKGDVPWHIAIANGQQVDFFSTNGEKISHFKVPDSVSLIGIAYDSNTQTMYMSDGGNKNKPPTVSIYKSSLKEKQSSLQTVLNHQENSCIAAMVFDPQDRSLFWTDGCLDTLMKMQIYPNGTYGDPITLFDLKDHRPMGIALDICNRYIYWANNHEKVHSIERSRLDGTERRVIADAGLYEVYDLAIDHYDGKLYWTDDRLGNTVIIERCNLDGTGREHFYNATARGPAYIAIDNASVYWDDLDANKVYRINKYQTAEDGPTIFPSYYETNTHFAVMSIMTKDNVGNINCVAVKEAKINNDNNNNNNNLVDDRSAQVDREEPSINSTDHATQMNLFNSNQSRVNCSNNGRYEESTGACICEKGYSGELCQTDLCLNYCVHGTCVIDDKNTASCKCGDLHNGERCENDICSGYCLNDGSCFASDAGPRCKCKDSWGPRCEYSTELDRLCFLYCSGSEDESNNLSETFCKCSELNKTLSQCMTATEPLLQSTIILSVLVAFIGSLVIVVGVLSYHIHRLRRRPRIRKRFVVSKGGVTPLTSRPQASADSCEITIENCCNMNICETPCFEPKLRTTPTKSSSTKKEEKNSLLDSMEGADSC